MTSPICRRTWGPLLALATLATASVVLAEGDDYLTWSAARAEALGRAMYQKGRVGGFFDTRILKTERSYNYKLAAVWLTPEVIRATARLQQLAQQLSDSDTRGLVRDAEAAGDTVVMVEIDPREGSGVIPPEWTAVLQPRFLDGRTVKGVRGVNTPDLRKVPALAGVLRRNYDYDRFWVVFPLEHEDGQPVLPADASEAEIVVRIHDKEGRVGWSIPASLRHRGKAAR